LRQYASCENLRSSPTPIKILQRRRQRQRRLRCIPPAREMRSDTLTPSDLHAEALEAERALPVRRGIVFVPETVAGFLRAACGAQYGLLPRSETRMWCDADRPSFIEREL
jgi:hypothetical protein